MLTKIFVIFILLVTPCYASVEFDGTDDSINISGPSSTSNDYTFSFWINRTNIFYVFDCNTGRIVISAGNSCASDLCIFDNVAFRNLGATIPTGEWHHLAVTADSSGSEVEGFLDGVSTGTDTYSDITVGGTQCSLGARFDQTTFNFAGSLDEFAIWTTVLTGREIELLAVSRVRHMPLQIQ